MSARADRLALVALAALMAWELRRIRKHQVALNEMILMGVNLDPCLVEASS